MSLVVDWQFEYNFESGTLIRPSTFNSILQGLDSWTTTVTAHLNDNVLALPGGVSTVLHSNEFPETGYSNSLLQITSENTLSYFSLNEFTTSITQASESATAAQEFANAAEQSANESQSSAEAAENSAEQCTETADSLNSALSTIEYLDSVSSAMRESDFNAITAAVRAQFEVSGFVEYGKYASNGSNLFPINQGLYANTSVSEQLLLGRESSSGKGISSTGHAVINVGGVLIDLDRIGSSSDSVRSRLLLPPAPDGTVTHNTSTGEVIQHANATDAFTAANADVNVQVVIDREDLIGVEVWDELISEKDWFPWLGEVQCGLTGTQTLNGVSFNLVQYSEQGYAAMYKGDTTTQGTGVVWSTLSDEQKNAIHAWAGTRIRNTKDGLVGRWVRARSIAGLQGEWDNVNPNSSTSWTLRQSSDGGSTTIQAQGSSVTPVSYGTDGVGGTGYYTKLGVSNASELKNVNSAFVARYAESIAYNGFCVFIPIGLKPRMNQGAYHPEFNKNGAAQFMNGGSFSQARPWYTTDANPQTTEDCFTLRTTSTSNDGSIGSTSGRPDGRFYDAIYAKPFRDLRVPVKGKWTLADGVDYVKTVSINGVASERASERVPFTQVWTEDASSDDYANKTFRINGTGDGKLMPISELPFEFTEGLTVYKVDNGVVTAYTTTTITSGYVTVNEAQTRKTGVYWWIPSLADAKSSMWTDIIAAPDVFLATFPNGCYGAWIGIADAANPHRLSRKSLDSTSSYVYTDNNGSTWSSSTRSIDTTLNQVGAVSVGRVLLEHYEFAPDFTEPADHVRVDHLQERLTALQAHFSYAGASLMTSLIGKVGTVGTYPRHTIIEGYTLSPTGKLISDGFTWNVKHPDIGLIESDSPAVKTIFYGHVDDAGFLEVYTPYKGLVNDSGADNIGDFNQVTVNSSTTYVAGEYYRLNHIDFSELNNKVFRCVLGQSRTPSSLIANHTLLANGNLIQGDGAIAFELWDGNGFGDDNEFIIANGDNVGVDENNNAIRYGLHKVQLPHPIYIGLNNKQGL